MVWLSLRVDYAAPSLVLLSKFCIVLSMIQSLDRLVLCVGCFWIKLKKLVPVIEGKAYDIEDASSFAMVLVQIHMCNEKEDDGVDSKGEQFPALIREIQGAKENNAMGYEVMSWADVVKKNHAVGGMGLNYVPPMKINNKPVQWHGWCMEDQGLRRFRRMASKNNSKGHMEIEVRAHLRGWKFIFLNNVRVLCQLPESYEAYKKQQHRWHSGPMMLFRLRLPAILTSKVTSTEEDAIETERRHHHHHHHHHHHEKPPMKVQTYPQPKAPAYPPKPAHHYHVKCDRRCEEYCKKKEHEKKECERICGHCCREYKCVPGPYDKCAAWDKVRYHDKWVECPKY
ncbi:hypothetical protein ACH5RR_014388 [Cinchona calisaya]|uniref:Uncharacterized protein n=1 Tax=Cinchona calisaya TaxID=153742 RepID=A0ABD3A534_9GENT